jgi:acetylornithine deacetylase/succinyl-diaminopimelate desuccinylase-like protein
VSAGCLTTDAGLTALRGIPTLVFGPGRGPEQLFRDDESAPLSHLETAFQFYRELIMAYCAEA